MKNFKNIFLFLIALPCTFFSCTEDDKINLDELFEGTRGGFIRFSREIPPSVVGVNEISEISYTFTIEDPNNNVALYDLNLFADLSGVRTDTIDVAEVTSFPNSFSFTAEELASLLNVTTDGISF